MNGDSRKCSDGKNLTLEDVKVAFRKAYQKNIKQSLSESAERVIPPKSKDGYYEFDSWEDYKNIVRRYRFGLSTIYSIFG